MRRISSAGILAAFVLALVPLHVQAAPPSVTGIRASVQNGAVIVQWQPAQGDIAYYRVYYSAQSILQNAGTYDDFETTPGPVTSHTLTDIPPAQKLYVSVLAVDMSGVESELFLEEASVIVDAGSIRPQLETSSAASSVSAPSLVTEPAEQTPPMVQLLSVDVTSATGVVLTFSEAVMVPADQAPEAFRIIDASGSVLPIRSVTLDGETVSIVTEPQYRHVVYELTLSEPLTGVNGKPLSLESRQTLFQGHPEGREPEMPAPASGVPDVRNLLVSAAENPDGTFTVTALWALPEYAGQIHGIVVAQSIDGGATFGAPEILARDVGMVEIPGLFPGNFALRVQVMDAMGDLSPGILQQVALGDAAPLPEDPQPSEPEGPVWVPPTGSVAEPPVTDSLPQSGPGLLAIAGMAIGTAIVRRRRNR